jgi:hypothetical protein
MYSSKRAAGDLFSMLARRGGMTESSRAMVTFPAVPRYDSEANSLDAKEQVSSHPAVWRE